MFDIDFTLQTGDNAFIRSVQYSVSMVVCAAARMNAAKDVAVTNYTFISEQDRRRKSAYDDLLRDPRLAYLLQKCWLLSNGRFDILLDWCFWTGNILSNESRAPQESPGYTLREMTAEDGLGKRYTP